MGQTRAGGGNLRQLMGACVCVCVCASVCRLPALHGEPAHETDREREREREKSKNVCVRMC